MCTGIGESKVGGGLCQMTSLMGGRNWKYNHTKHVEFDQTLVDSGVVVTTFIAADLLGSSCLLEFPTNKSPCCVRVAKHIL